MSISNIILTIILGVTAGLILIALAFVVITLLVKYIGKKSTDEAIVVTSNFAKKAYNALFTVEKGLQAVFYPVFIGWNGYEYRADIINDAFIKLERLWEVVYFETVITSNPNIIVYQFRIYNLFDENIPKKRLLAKVRRIAEEVLTKHFHEQGVYIPVDKFIATNLKQDILLIAIAVNDTGFEFIAKLRGQSH